MKSLLGILVSLSASVACPSAQEASPGPAKEAKPVKLKILCPKALSEDQALTLATRQEDGAWNRLDEIVLRSPYMSDWLAAKHGKLYLGTLSGEKFSINCTFEYPASTHDAIVVLLADPTTGKYRPDVIEPSKLKFSRGSTLLVNYSPQECAVVLGKSKYMIKPGGRLIAKPAPEENGMYRMLIGHTDQEKKLTACYDRAQKYNEKSREFLLLFPDPARNSVRVFVLPEFGSFE